MIENIEKWLKADQDRTWTHEKRPHTFISNKLEGLYVYEDSIQYIEDIRAFGVPVVCYELPKTEAQLLQFLAQARR